MTFSIHNICIYKDADQQDKSSHKLEAWWLALTFVSLFANGILYFEFHSFEPPYFETSLHQNFYNSQRNSIPLKFELEMFDRIYKWL